MQRWEYAAGEEDWRAYPGPKWENRSEPGTFEAAQVALMRLLAAEDPQSDYAMHGPCVIKRCEAQSEWQPVRDHAAELLVELLKDMASNFGRLGDGIVQGTDIKAICTHLARGMSTEPNQEYDT